MGRIQRRTYSSARLTCSQRSISTWPSRMQCNFCAVSLTQKKKNWMGRRIPALKCWLSYQHSVSLVFVVSLCRQLIQTTRWSVCHSQWLQAPHWNCQWTSVSPNSSGMRIYVTGRALIRPKLRLSSNTWSIWSNWRLDPGRRSQWARWRGDIADFCRHLNWLNDSLLHTVQYKSQLTQLQS